MRVVETLAGEQAARHEVLVASPLDPMSAVAWRRLELRGNADLGGHLRLLSLVRRYAPQAAILHAGSPGELALAAALLARRTPTVVVEHAPDHYPLRRPPRDWVLRRLKGRCHRWITVSRAGARHLEALWGLEAGRIGVIYTGVPAARPRPSEGATAGTVVALGRPLASKGFDTFRAVAEALGPRHPGVRWRWIGGAVGERRGAVEIVPWAADGEREAATATLLLIPSRVEGLPLALLEAWSAATPVVASAVGGIPELVRDGLDGRVLPAGCDDLWIAAVDQLLGDETLRRRLAEAGHRRWREELSAAAMAARWEALLEELWRER